MHIAIHIAVIKSTSIYINCAFNSTYAKVINSRNNSKILEIFLKSEVSNEVISKSVVFLFKKKNDFSLAIKYFI